MNDKMNKQARIENFFLQENTDPKGFEMECKKKSLGRADIHIDQLKVKEDEQGLPINMQKVIDLSDDIFSRVDPTQLILTVVPEDPASFSFESAERTNYVVVHGRHRYLIYCCSTGYF